MVSHFWDDLKEFFLIYLSSLRTYYKTLNKMSVKKDLYNNWRLYLFYIAYVIKNFYVLNINKAIELF